MEHRQSAMSDGLFWGLTGALFAAIMGGAIGYVFAIFYGAGWVGGGALGILVFLVAGIILARTATASNLPPPNTLRAPVAPPGGAFQAPRGGAFRAPDMPASEARSTPASAYTPAPAPSLAEMGHSAGEAVGKAAFSASAAVTSAAQAAKAAIADVMGAPETEVEGVRPPSLDAPRDGMADDLKRIRGVGPRLEELLHSLGYYHFDQIAAWDSTEVSWVDSHLEGFNGRATRDDWVGQSRILAAGGETEHSQRVDRGEST